MEKESFIKYMEELMRIKGIEDDLNKVLRRYANDFNNLFFTPYETLIVEILKDAMNDEYDWISYWLYDCDCGTNDNADSVKDKDGKKIPLRTLDDLYNIIKNS